MSSTFSGLSTALNALMAQRAGLTVTGQNIANANTAGYSRQRAELAALGTPSQVGFNASALIDRVGSGVTVDSLRRLADVFVDARQRDAHANASYTQAQATAFSQIENILGEPSDTGLSKDLAAFWSSWQDLANAPDSIPARQAVMSNATSVAGTLRRGRDALDAAYTDTRSHLDTLATEVNTTAQGVAALNDKIRIAGASGDPANELIDQRDQMVLRLSELVGARSTANDDGTVSLSVSGVTIVSSTKAYALQVADGTSIDSLSSAPLKLTWTNGAAATLTSGELGGLVDSLRSTYPDAAAGYDQVASTLGSTVNAIHATGQDLDGDSSAPGAFFTGTTASTLAVAFTDPRKVRAAVANPSGTPSLDSSIADQIGQLATSTTGADARWSAFVAATGVASASAQNQVTVHAAISQNADGARQSVSGVSLDEEMSNMLMYQRAYEGAGRMMTAIDQMLDTLINRTGQVGR
ncbi:flagellar hook-associated protein FlgK [Angustibacter sp. Root456]|uniref:flagellar hook-associated protein FlgK n=1 Tax=Angustibacter sp. Root456 TaxID=1736539 RepID=UPI0006F96F38|nr:flagellar hook-associated protein FlgK [Angustibacter sp. Root456]KQX69530.1 hypothetical protein ASD06_00155 [Angustibacter sp. Root456]